MRLTLFMTRGLSLRSWQDGGMFAREVALYKRLRDLGIEVGIITYGAASENVFGDGLNGIRILYNQWGLPVWLYAMLIPTLHRDWLKGTDLIKSNQTNGAEMALRAARMFEKPLIARCGFMWSLNTARTHGERSLRSRYARYVEQRVFSGADCIVVTTDAMVENVKSRFPQSANKVVRIPNYVETDRFIPCASVTPDIDLLFVGRLTPEKNLENLLLALQSTEFSLAIVGSGSSRRVLEERYGSMDGRVRWLGTVPNFELPDLFRRARLFVQPSYYEGHPKALLEALACGVPVLGTRVPGIRDIIQHDENGWLCETSAESIRAAIISLMGNDELRQRLGKQGRACVIENFGLDQVVESEIKLYEEIIASSA
jgi:glycosyltransferase involved in cell wall biosynthesis